MSFVVGAVVGVYLWFTIVLALSARAERWNARHGPPIRRALAVALAAFGVWAIIGAIVS